MRKLFYSMLQWKMKLKEKRILIIMLKFKMMISMPMVIENKYTIESVRLYEWNLQRTENRKHNELNFILKIRFFVHKHNLNKKKKKMWVAFGKINEIKQFMKTKCRKGKINKQTWFKGKFYRIREQNYDFFFIYFFFFL